MHYIAEDSHHDNWKGSDANIDGVETLYYGFKEKEDPALCAWILVE